MATENDRVDTYRDTIERMELAITVVDHNTALASIAISLKRIADSLDDLTGMVEDKLTGIEMNTRRS